MSKPAKFPQPLDYVLCIAFVALIAFLALCAPPLHAATLYRCDYEPERVVAHLTDEEVGCEKYQGRAKRVHWTQGDGSTSYPGCYILEGGTVSIIFDDGDVSQFPFKRLCRPNV